MRLCHGLEVGLVAVSVVLVMWLAGVGREEPVRSFVSSREAHPVPELLLKAISNPEAHNYSVMQNSIISRPLRYT